MSLPTHRLLSRGLTTLALAIISLAHTSCDPSSGGGVGNMGGYQGNPQIAPGVRSFVIMDYDTGYMLDYRAPHQKVQVGSLTKIATALVVQNWLEATRVSTATNVPIPPVALSFGGPNPLGLQPGDTMTIRDLQYAALMNSDNISAFALADYVGAALMQSGYGGSTPQEAFVVQMNGLAQQLGMTNTRFTNAAGLDSIGGPEPYSTAADLARLTKAAIGRPSFQFAVSQTTRQVSINRGGQQFAFTLRNTNELLGQNGINGVKTGLTPLAGGCVILAGEKAPKVWQEGETFYRMNRHVIVVVLGTQNRFGDGATLMQYAWGVQEPWLQQNRPMDEATPGRRLQPPVVQARQ